MYGCESWTIKKAEHWRIDALELWCWRRLLRVHWTARRSNQSILKEISLECSLEGLMLKLKLMPMESVMPSNYLILCYLLLLPPSIFPSIRIFSNESTLCIRWPKHWSFSFSISSSNEHSGLISFLGLIGLISLKPKGLSRVFSNTTVQKHQVFGAQPSLWSNSHIHT